MRKIVEIRVEVQDDPRFINGALSALRGSALTLRDVGWTVEITEYDADALCRCDHPRSDHYETPGGLWCFGHESEEEQPDGSVVVEGDCDCDEFEVQ